MISLVRMPAIPCNISLNLFDSTCVCIGEGAVFFFGGYHLLAESYVPMTQGHWGQEFSQRHKVICVRGVRFLIGGYIL